MKKNGSNTSVMGASFRNINQIMDLAGVDYLTISPNLLHDLSTKTHEILKEESMNFDYYIQPEFASTKREFYDQFKSDVMAKELLEEGIQKFSDDISKIENELSSFIS
jgi:transaldolase